MPFTPVSRILRKGGVAKAVAPKSGQKQSRPLQNAAVKSTPKKPQTPRSSQGFASSTSRSRKGESGEEEKRLRRHRPKPPVSFLVKLERAQTQRMVVLGRTRKTLAGAPAEDIDIVGSTGNIYTVTISHLPSCSCPDSLKGHECKHKVYALHTVLKSPYHLQYQLALLTSELEDIFAAAPPVPTDLAEDSKGSRKPTDGECPICYMDLDESHNKLVWCKAQCGHNLHESCFAQWAASQGGREVRCVYCRTPWETDAGDLQALKEQGEQGEDGYVNVADAFGLSRSRDYSGYYQPWARGYFRDDW